ncbi:MAG: galactonate dehydratase [Bryobacter sp.]
MGWGEAASLSPAALVRARELVVGQEPSRYDFLTRQFAAEPMAGALNMALLDLAGKAANAPVYQLLGGPTRNRVRAIVAAANPAAREQFATQGHRAFLVPLALPQAITSRPKLVAGVVEEFSALRKSLGENADFAVDGQAGLPALEATDIAVALEPLHPLWVERLVREPNAEVLSRISNECATPLGLGNEMTGIGPVQNLLREGNVDLIRLPLQRLGLTPLRRAAALAETYYTAVAPTHAEGGPLTTVAALHLAASIPNYFIQEVPAVLFAEARNLRDALVRGSWEAVREGYLSLPTKPGLGVEIDESIVRRMAQ